MAEYIDREAIYKAIGELTPSFRLGESGAYYADWRIDTMIGNLPAADVGEVVRCKDCKNNPRFERKGKHTVWCRQWRSEVKETGFCSYGERKADNA